MIQRAIGFGLQDLPRIVRGEGSYLLDADGRRYLDGSGGPAAFCLGHAHPEVNAAIAEQLGRVACGYRYLFTSTPLEELTELILRRSGATFGHVVYCSSGSEAVEAALKMALQYWDAQRQPQRRRFIARQRSYHGNTLGALSVSGFAERRRPFEGSLLEVSFVSAANSYRPPSSMAEVGLTAALAEELEQAIRRLGSDTVAAFIFEPVVGAAGGVVPAPPGYVAAIRRVCDRHGVLLIADEVMCGAGRCGTWRALEHESVAPDIMAIAKGFSGGYIPVGATVCSAEVGNTILREQGSFMTGHTYSGHTAGCAAALAVQRIIERDSLLQRVQQRGALLKSALQDSLGGIAQIGDIRGRGYFIGLEIVRDPQTKQPYARELAVSHQIAQQAFEDGLICYPCAGHVGEGAGDTLIIAPPFNASDAELEELVSKLNGAVTTVLQRLT
jgi:adenosylmethionine-8-amino-7-oxononanoate aminotransferase